jgi:hypothetical protein
VCGLSRPVLAGATELGSKMVASRSWDVPVLDTGTMYFDEPRILSSGNLQPQLGDSRWMRHPTPATRPRHQPSSVPTRSRLSIWMALQHSEFVTAQIQIELASRRLIPLEDGAVQVEFLCTGHLRCSPNAARQLREAIESALQMLERPPTEPTVASSKLN